jgi:hypothetical protein
VAVAAQQQCGRQPADPRSHDHDLSHAHLRAAAGSNPNTGPERAAVC